MHLGPRGGSYFSLRKEESGMLTSIEIADLAFSLLRGGGMRLARAF
jgi:hypothetical protein